LKHGRKDGSSFGEGQVHTDKTASSIFLLLMIFLSKGKMMKVYKLKKKSTEESLQI
jgi:hypothetical protein